MPRLIGAAQSTAPATQAEQITTFNSSGTLTTQPQTTVIEYLVVAGGGGGQHGGGGGGGFRTGTCNPVTGGSPYPVTVGAGGAADTSNPAFGRISASNGSDSVLGTPVPITSAGGGGGGAPSQYAPGWPYVFGNDGGSGGGSGASCSPVPAQPTPNQSAGNTPPVSPPQGNPGGTALISGFGYRWSAGGGGAGSAGVTGDSATNAYGVPEPTGYFVWAGGTGGEGAPSTISGTDVKYAGGGGGSFARAACSPVYPAPSPLQEVPSGSGRDGGGHGARSPQNPAPANSGTAGTANTGGGGGGAVGGTMLDVNPGTGGSGGSGIVIVKEAAVNYFTGTSSVWDLRTVYRLVKESSWPTN